MANEAYMVNLPPREALDSVVACFVESGTYAVESRSDTSVTFVREKNPDFILGCLLLILGLVPGLIYLGLAGGTVRLTVLAEATGEGKARVTFGTFYWLDRRWVKEWLRTVELEKPNLRDHGRDPNLKNPQDQKQRQRIEEARGRADWHSHPDDEN